MIVRSQPETDELAQKSEAPVAAVSAAKIRGCRRLNQIAVRFRLEVGFQVPICCEFETPFHETLLPALNEAREALAVV
jgi:2-oxoglutarate dehydrogenase complex dehydrogenase (E1) component-like enzyme